MAGVIIHKICQTRRLPSVPARKTPARPFCKGLVHNDQAHKHTIPHTRYQMVTCREWRHRRLTRSAMSVQIRSSSSNLVVMTCSLKPKQGSQVLIQHGGGTELTTLRGKSLITEDGEAIEGEALDDVTVIGVVTFTICDVRQDNAVV